MTLSDLSSFSQANPHTVLKVPRPKPDWRYYQPGLIFKLKTGTAWTELMSPMMMTKTILSWTKETIDFLKSMYMYILRIVTSPTQPQHKLGVKSITPFLHRLIFEPIGKLSQPNSASTLVGSDTIMGRNLPYPPTHHQELSGNLGSCFLVHNLT
jgi:hypothetical protein